MAIILKSTMAGPGGVHQAGDRVELGAQQERELVEGGYAHYVKAAERAETATPRPRETAAMPPVRRDRKSSQGGPAPRPPSKE